MARSSSSYKSGISMLAWAVLQTYLLTSYGVPFWYAAADAAITGSMLVSVGMLINFNLQFYLPQKEKYWYIIIVSLIMGSAAYFITTRILKFLPNETYQVILSNSETIRYAFLVLMTGTMAIMSLLSRTQKEQAAVDRLKAETALLARDAELYKLRQQLQPHFLFNSLNSISALASTQPEKARHMIQQLSDFLRGTLRKGEDQWTTLRHELEHLQLYLDIEKVRFGHRLNTEVNCDDEACAMQLPSLLLQPLVENAIKFGLYGVTGSVLIKIKAIKEEGVLVVMIQNPFDADMGEASKGTGFGLASVQRRLFLLFGRKDLLEVEAQDNIFTSTLRIPQQAITQAP